MSLFNIFGKKSEPTTRNAKSKPVSENKIVHRKIKVKCYECGGKGVVECDCTGGCGKDAANDDCYACGGSGYCTCPACGGAKWIYEDE